MCVIGAAGLLLSGTLQRALVTVALHAVDVRFTAFLPDLHLVVLSCLFVTSVLALLALILGSGFVAFDGCGVSRLALDIILVLDLQDV